MDVITTAIISALAALSQDAIEDSYNALKSALMKKFGSDSDLVDAVNKLEKTPERNDRQATVKAEVEIAKVNDDSDLVNLAQDLLDKIKEQPGGQKIINQIQTNTMSNVNAGGDVVFNPVQKS